MFCRKCGQEIKEGAKFCIKCGTPVSQPQQPAPQQQPTPQMQQPEPQQQEPAPQPQQPEPQQQEPAPQPQQPVPQPQWTGSQMQQPNPPQKKGKNTGIIIAVVCIIAAVCVIAVLLIAILGLRAYSSYISDEKNEVSSWEEPDDDDDEDDDDDDDRKTDDMNDNDSSEQPEMDTEGILKDTEAMSDAEEAAAPDTEAEEKPHTYQIIVKDVTWTEAYREALNVPNGYLVNIDTEEEWNTILKQIQAEQKAECIFWIGAVRRGDTDDYYWVDAEGNSVGNSLNGNSNWLTGEPTFYDDENNMEERYVDMFFSKSENRWVWNDTPDDLISLLSYYSGKVAYIVEIENE